MNLDEIRVRTIVFVLVFIILSLIKRYLKYKVKEKTRDLISDEKIKVLIKESDFDIKKTLFRIVTYLISFLYLLNLFVYFYYLLHIIPYTYPIIEFIDNTVFEIMDTIWNSVVDYFPKLMAVFIYIIIFYLILKFLKHFFRVIEQGKVKIFNIKRNWAKPTYYIVVLLVSIFMLIVIIQFLPGFGSTQFTIIVTVFGGIISFASHHIISNAIGGLAILYSSKYQINDRVRLLETEGIILTIGLLSTVIKTDKNELVDIPNGRMMDNSMINYSRFHDEYSFIIHKTVTIGYEVNQNIVKGLLLKASRITEGVKSIEKSKVLVNELDDYYVHYEINVEILNPLNRQKVESDLHTNILMVFNEAKVEILSPQYRVVRTVNKLY